MRLAATIGTGAALFVGGVAVGHFAGPTRVVYRDRTVSVAEDMKAAQTAVATAVNLDAQRDDSKTHVRVIRIVEHPDGTKEAVTTDRDTVRAHVANHRADAKIETKTEIEYRDRIEVREHEKLVERVSQSRYSVAVLGGVSIDARAPVAAVQFSGQVFGPVSVVVQAQKTFGGTPLDGWAALAGAEVRW